MSGCISTVLKSKRKSLNLSVKEVLDTLHTHGIDISDKTLYGWESGHRQPDADTFIVLCQIYGIDSFSSITKAPSISDEAMKIARDYNDLDDHGKNVVKVVISAEQKRISQSREEAELFPGVKVLKIAGRDGSFKEVRLTEEQRKDFHAYLDRLQLEDASDIL